MIRRYPIGSLFVILSLLVLAVLTGRKMLIRTFRTATIQKNAQTNGQTNGKFGRLSLPIPKQSFTPLKRAPAQVADATPHSPLQWNESSEPTEPSEPTNTRLGWDAPRRGRRTLSSVLLRRLTAIIPSILICGLFILWHLKRQAKIAKAVFHRLHEGDLSARLPESSLARYGGLVETFNQMANDIEGLVGKLRKGEAMRSETLQDLAHDVRTPLSALQLLHEFMGTLSKSTSTKEFATTLVKAQAEVKYIQKIIEGFLILAQIEDPAFKRTSRPLVLYDAIMAETLPLQDMPDKLDLKWEIVDRLPPNQMISVDPLLFSRAIRNVLSNAVRFAATHVTVLIELDAKRNIRILVRDDGPGFSAESLASFGERKKLRIIDPSIPSEVSIGLGTVILKRIVTIFGGSVFAQNRNDQKGAEVIITLPRDIHSQTVRAA